MRHRASGPATARGSFRGAPRRREPERALERQHSHGTPRDDPILTHHTGDRRRDRAARGLRRRGRRPGRRGRGRRHREPEQWYDAVVDAKLGDPSAVVVLGLTPAWPDCQQDPGDLNGAHWAEFVAAWGDHGVHGDVCGTAADYVAFFESAVATIDQACDE
jgi:hypothetical protein